MKIKVGDRVFSSENQRNSAWTCMPGRLCGGGEYVKTLADEIERLSTENTELKRTFAERSLDEQRVLQSHIKHLTAENSDLQFKLECEATISRDKQRKLKEKIEVAFKAGYSGGFTLGRAHGTEFYPDEAFSDWDADPASGKQNPCANGHDFVSRGDGTAKCADCPEIVDVSETGAARSGRVDGRESS